MGLGRFLLDWHNLALIRKSRLYWNPLRRQKRLYPQQCKWDKGVLTNKALFNQWL
jgi:hypothetical protein